MIIYLPGAGAQRAPLHTLFAAPAAEIGSEAPAEWRSADGAPLTIPVEFRFGRAEVPDNLGAFMVARGYAARTSLILPDHLSA